MRFVIRTSPGVVELNWMWMPAFLAHDAALKKRIEDELAPLLTGKELTEDLLDAAHEHALDVMCAWHKSLTSLRDYLDAIKFVDERAT